MNKILKNSILTIDISYIVVLPKSWFMWAHIYLTYLGRPALKKFKTGEKL